MLNTCLTVKAGSPGSHSNRGWENFTDKVIAIVDKWGGANLPANSSAKVGVGRGVVFMAWGSWAQKRVSGLNRVSQTLIPPRLLPGPFWGYDVCGAAVHSTGFPLIFAFMKTFVS